VFTFHALFTNPFRAGGGKRVNTQQKYGSTKRQIEPLNHGGLYQSAGDLEDVRTYGYKASRAAALIYAHFKKEFEMPLIRHLS
jgi:hypothetical protein